MIFVLIPSLVLFLVFYGPYFIPGHSGSLDGDEVVTILTFNLRYNNYKLESISKVILSSHADLLALQEVTGLHEDYLQKALSESYAYHIYYEGSGLAVYSKFPILEQKAYLSTDWPVLSTVIQMNNKRFTLINAHFARVGLLEFLSSFDVVQVRELERTREEQIALINQITGENNLPAIVACDCNMTNLNTPYVRMTSHLGDAFRDRGWGFGNTLLLPRALGIKSRINLPFQRVDYLFYSPGIKVLKVNVSRFDTGSDHLPLLASFDL
jgi:endonuclease/exonuclease/phosphatase family metal-dependent hydrolase